MSVSYERVLVLLHQICHDVGFWEDISVFERLIEYGWIKPKDDGTRPDINGSHSAHWYVLTTQGHSMLSPRENRAEGLPVPFFVVKGRPFYTTPDGQQALVHLDALEARA